MPGVAAEQELYHACRIIFGAELTVSREFLEYIQPAGVKSAFRRKAMEIHPDRLIGKDELTKKRNTRLFHDVRQAYEKLLQYLQARDKGFRFPGLCPLPPAPSAFTVKRNPAPSRQQWGRKAESRPDCPPDSRDWQKKYRAGPFARGDAGQKAPCQPGRHRGPVPARTMLFGHYLYYAGQVSWQSIVKAVMWQRTQRPRLGEIARARGWLSREDTFLVLTGSHSSSLPFGQQAVRQGLLSRTQLHALLAEQQRQHKKIGEFFVRQKLMTPLQLEVLLADFRRHNARQSSFRFSRKDSDI
ncbi:MAG: molecular chaperone DnaJ [Deltaproteobacteria bacterium]|nr:molecular chaperone DnaJ [Deltaproteobacteria bacterium]